MPLFTPPDEGVIDAFHFEEPQATKSLITKVGAAQPKGALAAAGAQGGDLSKQFVIFQFSGQAVGPSVIEASQVEPAFAGGEEQPDVLVGVEMLSFHLGEPDREKLGPNTRAMMRINFGKDESSTDRRFDTVFWSIAAGLNLYDQVRNRTPEAKEFKSDLQKAFSNRPIEIPGGLGRLSFEVVKHQDPTFWQRIFGFIQSEAGQNLVSVLGFPALTNQAIKVLDQLLDKVFPADREALFHSLPLRLALTKSAREAFTGGSPRVKIGTLRPGFCIMARGGDFKALADTDYFYHASYGLLVPKDVSDADLLAGTYKDPLQGVTYVMFRIGMQARKLDPTFSYGS
jgi:hypothetical protein